MGAKLGLPSNMKGSPISASNADSWVTTNGIVLASPTAPSRPNNMGFGSKQVEIQKRVQSDLELRVVEAKTMTEWENLAIDQVKNLPRW